MLEILLTALLFALAWFWWDSIRSREIASLAGKKLCKRFEVQLLDDSINLKSLYFRRLPPPAAFPFWEINRCYHFDFTSNGKERQEGEVYLQDKQVVGINLPGYYEKVLSNQN